MRIMLFRNPFCRSTPLSNLFSRRWPRFGVSNVDRVMEAKRGYRRRLLVEPLEDRRMMAGDADDIAIGAGDLFDRFEENDSRPEAAVLGSETEITEHDLSRTSGDDDFYKVTAHSTGKLVVRIYFQNNRGNLDLEVQDANGNLLAQSTGLADNEDVIIPVVSQQMYFVRVFGGAQVSNLYDLEIENFPAPVPTGVHLDPASDTGSLNNDNVTSDTTPTVFIQTDVLEFVDTNSTGVFVEGADEITALNPGADGQFNEPALEPEDGNEAGIAVEVTFVNTTNPLSPSVTGFAQAIVDSSPEVYRFTPTTPLAPGVYFVTARTKVFDQQDTNAVLPGFQRAMGRSNASPPLWLTIATGAPGLDGATIDLLASSDSGMANDDNVTNKMQPALSGLGPANARVFVFAQQTTALGVPVGAALLVGSGVVGSDLSDGVPGGGNLGLWEITTEPLTDGKYNFSARFEGANGILSDPVVASSASVQISPGVAIPDGGTVTATINHSGTGTVNDLSVQVNIEHFRDEDLDIVLVSPSGTRVRLAADRGGFGANYTNTLFTDAAAVAISAGIPPFTGTFRPEQPLSAVFGQNVAGTWTLEVTDDSANESVGRLVSFGLTFQNPLMVVVDTVAPNTPYLDLLDDTGRHDNDNITKDTMPSVSMTTTDPNASLARLLFTDNLKFRIFDRFENSAQEVLIYDSAQDPAADAFMTPGDMFTAFTQLTRALPFLSPASPAIVAGTLANGVHNLKLEVEDRAGNISEDFLLEITVDAVPPPVSFGLPDAASMSDGLHADSDTGVASVPATSADRVTSDTTPRVWGRAEADSVVRIFLDRNNNGVVDLATDTFLGQTVAVPFDGNDAYPDGYWEINSVRDLNEVVGVPIDGLRRLLVTAEDQAGNPMPMDGVIRENVDELQIFIDTQGPRITSISPNGTDFDLFDPKPSLNGFTPLVNSLKIAVRDLPLRLDQPGVDNDFLYEAIVEAIAENPGSFLLVGDHVGQIAIESVTVMFDPATGGSAATAMVILDFFAPLPDDRFTLTVRDDILDPAGNLLDGESNSIEPQAPPFFPTGNLVVGGDFIARFTVDSRPDIGTYVAQDIDIDINGNFVWDPANAQIGNDATNVDISFTLPVANGDGSVGLGGYNVHDLVFAGKFRPRTPTNGNNGNNGNDTAAGAGDLEPIVGLRFFDQLAAFGHSAELGSFRWIIDTNSDGVVNAVTDILSLQPAVAGFNVAGALPVAGNFDNNAANGDEIGLYNAGRWALDTNHNFVIDAADTFITNNLFGHPIVGDFDGDGLDDLAVFNNNVFSFNLANDTLTDSADATMIWGYPGVLDRPVAADMDQDGIDDIGLWVPRTSASLPRGIAEWYFLLSNHFILTGVPAVHTPGTIARLNHAFTPVPFGKDLYAEFGDERSLPIVGNFDPPVAARPAPGSGSGLVGDYDGNGRVEQADHAVWRANYGSTTSLGADGNRNGIVDLADMVLWRKNLGTSVSTGAVFLAEAGGNEDVVVDSVTRMSFAAETELAPVVGRLTDAETTVRIAAIDGAFAAVSANRPAQSAFRPLQRVATGRPSDGLLLTELTAPTRQARGQELATRREDDERAEAVVDRLLAEFSGIDGLTDLN
jgi:subtilisin-like proprotein convertase family protein